MKQPFTQIALDFFSQEEQTPTPEQPAASQVAGPAEGEVLLPQKEENGELPEKVKVDLPQEGYAGGVFFRIKSLKKATEEKPIPAIQTIPVPPSAGSEPAAGTGAKAWEVLKVGEVPNAGEVPKVGEEAEAGKRAEAGEKAGIGENADLPTAAARIEAEKEPNPVRMVEAELQEEDKETAETWYGEISGEVITGGTITEVPTVSAPEKIMKSKRGRKSLKQATAEADLIEIPVDEVLFRKQYYTMGEVAEMFRVNQSLLRFWETEFHMLKPRKNKKGDRYFRPADIKSLHLIYHLLRQRKYTIEGAKEFLKNNKKSEDRFDAIQRLQAVKAFLLEWKAQL